MKALLLSTLIAMLSWSHSLAQHGGHGSLDSDGSLDKPSVHGMFLCGGKGGDALYASHLPLFHAPHDYQILLELRLNASSQAAYKQSLQKFPRETVYTIEPEKFVLPQMIAAPRPFKATLYRGHFERGGKPIAEATVEIAQTLYFKKFDTSAQHGGTPYYLVFGTKKQKYAAHLISAKPDFDQILEISGDAECKPASAELLMMLDNGETKGNTQGMKAGSQMIALQARIKRHIHVVKSLYLEYDDLK
jgi:hypothetical protein